MKKLALFAAILLVMVACKKEENTPTYSEFISVAPGKQVCFASGNLQYMPSANIWRMAPNPWDAIKDLNTQASPDYDGWVDYFTWGCSGFNFQDPVFYTGEPEELYHEGSIAGTNYDWGVFNAIDNNGTIDPAGTWRTLTSEEWDYILFKRPAATINGVANARYANATVNGQVGIIIFPDYPHIVEGVTYPAAATIDTATAYTINDYTADSWAKLQEQGFVFMPSAGCKSVANNSTVACDFLGCYWTSSLVGEDDGLYLAGQVLFNPNLTEVKSAGIIYPRCVRLAKDVK